MLAQLQHLPVYPQSVIEQNAVTYFLLKPTADQPKRLGVLGDASGFTGEKDSASGALLCPLTPENAETLRDRLPWLRPVALQLKTSAGFGDRLGIATPGHARSIKNTGIAPIFAQQSVRENTRTGRTPQQVMDDAMWGVFQVGWREPWGGDADHLKIPEVIDDFVDAGYTFYTIDPSDYVDNEAETADEAALKTKIAALAWDSLESSYPAMREQYVGKTVDLGDGFTLTFDEITLLRAVAKYGGAVGHTAMMYRCLKTRLGDVPFDLEMSVDETETPTSPHEHFYIASELKRLGVEWVSLAPRFVGRFEKGVDYIGSLDDLDANIAQHAAIMRYFGGYKLSLHSGSDKFAVYPIAARHTNGLVHLKTAGTSYLEALRVIAQVDAGFFREILTLSRARYETDRATYHVSALLDKVPAPEDLSDSDLPDLLEQFDARQVLHVTFGSVLDEFGARLQAVLAQNEDLYHEIIERHFDRHLQPLSRS
jgi:hypothetical protein